MKSIAAVAIANGCTIPQVTASGIIVGLIIFLLTITNLLTLVNDIVPKEVVGGLQLGVGLKLSVLGVEKIMELGFIDKIDCQVFACFVGCLTMVLLKAQDGVAKKKNCGEESGTDTVNVGEGNILSSSSSTGANAESSLTASQQPTKQQSLLAKIQSSIKGKPLPPAAITIFVIGIFLSILELTTTSDPAYYNLPIKLFTFKTHPLIFWIHLGAKFEGS